VDPGAASALALARFQLAPDARVRIEAGVVTERRREGVCFHVESGGELHVGAGTWLRSDLGPVHIMVFEGARLHIGPESFLNGCHLSAKREVLLGRRAWIGPGSRIFDSDQHDYDADRPEQSRPVHIGDHTWIASDVTVLKGVTVGDHSIVGARSLVLKDVEPHSIVAGSPATPRGTTGDRSQTR
jgi:maltose O-acetyltransferase